MFSNQPVELSLDISCRTVTPLQCRNNDNDASRFIVGSCQVQTLQQRQNMNDDASISANTMINQNALHQVTFYSDTNELVLERSFMHPTGPVRAMATKLQHNDNSSYDMVVTAAERSKEAVLWRMNTNFNNSSGLDDTDMSNNEDNNMMLEQIVLLNPSNNDTKTAISTSDIVDIKWWNTPEDEAALHSTSTSTDGDSSNSHAGAVVLVDAQGRLSQWDISQFDAACLRVDESLITRQRSSSSRVPGSSFSPHVAWDPHGNGNLLAASYGTSINLIDWRTDTSITLGTVTSFNINRRNVHCSYGGYVTDLDYNPNKPYIVATASQALTSSQLLFWDTRTTQRPLLAAAGGHSHWTTCVQYNPSHDQLVLSTGTDGIANVWRMSTISSAPLLQLHDDDDDDDNGRGDNDSNNENNNHGNLNSDNYSQKSDASNAMSETAAPNVRVTSYDQGQSIYDACWSHSDPWVYVTVSYDGKVVAHQVPSKEKYKILL